MKILIVEEYKQLADAVSILLENTIICPISLMMEKMDWTWL